MPRYERYSGESAGDARERIAGNRAQDRRGGAGRAPNRGPNGNARLTRGNGTPGRGGNRRPNQGAGQHGHGMGHTHLLPSHQHFSEGWTEGQTGNVTYYPQVGTTSASGSLADFQTGRSGRHQHTGQIGGRQPNRRTMGSKNPRRGGGRDY